MKSEVPNEPEAAAERRQNVATAFGRGFRVGQDKAPAGAKDSSSPDRLSPLPGLAFRDKSFPRPSAVATFWRRFAAEQPMHLTLRLNSAQ